MARNVEIKARVDDMERTRRLAANAADRGPETITQRDTFFEVEVGRLKLREFSDSEGELIYYRRPDSVGPKESQYERTPVSNAPALLDLFSKRLGVLGCVRKRRLVYWVERTRIHLDGVEGLGNFLELEVVLNEQEPYEAAVREVEMLMDRLEIETATLVSDAYIDLLHRRQKTLDIS
jgi:predicted adenylyl cyclase CyaB